MLNSEELKNDTLFKEIIYITILNIKNEYRKYYDLSNREKSLQYFQKYYYLMNELFLSFNSYLIQKYIEKNKKFPSKKDTNWKDIYNNRNDINSVEYLLSFLFKKDNPSIDEIHTINLLKIYFSIYDNLFRHQICHGCINLFGEIHNLETKIIIPHTQINSNNDIFKQIKNFYSGHEKSLYDSRIEIKKNVTSPNILHFIEFGYPTNDYLIQELGLQIELDDYNINVLRVKEILNSQKYTETDILISSIKNISQLSQVEKLTLLEKINKITFQDDFDIIQLKLLCYDLVDNNKKAKSTSLNNLLKDILLVVIELNSHNN